MARVSISSSGDLDFSNLMSHMLDVPDAIGNLLRPSSRSHRNSESKGNIPVDILDSPNELVLYMDVPGLSKSDIQVTVEEEKLLVVKSNGKRKRDEEEEGCKYLRLERRPVKNVMRKFRLPEDCDASEISAKCENGVLTVVVRSCLRRPNPRGLKLRLSRENV